MPVSIFLIAVGVDSSFPAEGIFEQNVNGSIGLIVATLLQVTLWRPVLCLCSGPNMRLLAKPKASLGVKFTPTIPDGALLLSCGLSQPVTSPKVAVTVL